MKKEYQIKMFRPSNYSYYRAASGYFSVSSKIDEENRTVYRGNWQSCRETFSRFFSVKTKIILMACDSTERENCINFLSNCETRLKIGKSKSVLCNENGEYALAIILNPWWTENLMRRQLLTVLLRAGQSYKGNFDKTLNSYGYSKQTKEAIYKFFDGYTIFPNFRGGWVNNFAPRKRWGFSDMQRNLAKMEKDAPGV